MNQPNGESLSPPTPDPDSPLAPRQAAGPRIASWLLAIIAAVLIAAPVLLSFATGWRGEGNLPQLLPRTSLILKTLAWALGIGTLGTLAAAAAAWWARSRPWATPLLLAPLLLPQYLAYSGWGLLRAPGTWLGEFAGHATSEGFTWVPIAISRAIAVLGLTLWVWPIGFIVMLASVRRIDDGVLLSLRLEPMGAARRAAELARSVRGGFFASVGLIAAVVVGSAVPLHLAQAPTLAIDLWATMLLEPGSPAVWAKAWPLVAAAIVAALLISRLGVGRTDEVDAAPAQRGGGWVSGAWTVGLLAASILAPVALFWGVAPPWREVAAFAHRTSGAFAASGGVAAACGAVSIVLCCIASYAASSGGRELGGAAFIWLLGLLIPGVLIGGAWGAVLAAGPIWWSEQPAVLVVVHTARFGVVAVLAGLWLAGRETREEQRLRSVDGATGPVAWFMAVAKWQIGGWLAAGVAGSALSLQEIEASIMVQPPGTPSLPQTILGYLHFSRDDDLASAMLILAPGALVLAGIAGGLMLLAARQSRRSQIRPGSNRAASPDAS